MRVGDRKVPKKLKSQPSLYNGDSDLVSGWKARTDTKIVLGPPHTHTPSGIHTNPQTHTHYTHILKRRRPGMVACAFNPCA